MGGTKVLMVLLGDVELGISDAGELGVLLINRLGTFETVVLGTLLAVKLGTSDAGECVAEQNSLDLAWYTLMEPQYHEWRATILTNECERHRFCQLVVNSVFATDIVDTTLRNARWDKAFKPEQVTAKDINPRDAVHRKATIVIENLIQASDVSHTMQHWHVFRKWNQRLFEEMHAAYRSGRAAKDPSEFWYQGEIGHYSVSAEN
jgi:3'5'-cyclic nucleotide phosphodiesterase